MACANISMDIQQPDEGEHDYDGHEEQGGKPLIKYYQPTELIPARKGPLHDLLLKQPAVLGFFIAGLLSNMLFKFPRLLQVIGVRPYVNICLLVNIGSIGVAIVGGVLIVVDLALWDDKAKDHMKLEALVLCVLLEEVIVTAVSSFWIHNKKPTHDM
ncbi:hypothetical protein DPEC_G00140300 [Dallia pectoralis]|uniref:Uncharacterized protein n=1 Tax=Dallia pectoralis TaxID=75939 RepID=A0ACC2GMY7_DALPE|nr:hypothetical protein DPEC_G00140300 [Dallia pectoralis]